MQSVDLLSYHASSADNSKEWPCSEGKGGEYLPPFYALRSLGENSKHCCLSFKQTSLWMSFNSKTLIKLSKGKESEGWCNRPLSFVSANDFVNLSQHFCNFTHDGLCFSQGKSKNFHFKYALHVTTFNQAQSPCETLKSKVNSVRPQAWCGKLGYEAVEFICSNRKGVLLFQVVASQMLSGRRLQQCPFCWTAMEQSCGVTEHSSWLLTSAVWQPSLFSDCAQNL